MADEPREPDLEALTDQATHLPNRLHFDVVYRVAFAAGTRGFPITVLLIEAPAVAEVDPAGLEDFAGRLASVTRNMDLVARVEDTRFVGLLLDCNVHGGHIAADRILATLDPWLEEHGAVVNVGVASFQEEMETQDELMSAAKAALERAREIEGSAVETAP